jgi:YD repeat-containing protein
MRVFTTQYAWDFEHRLTQVTLPSGDIVAYKYDALGRRIERTAMSLFYSMIGLKRAGCD